MAKTLNPQCYKRNPDFLQYKDKSNIPFEAHEHFRKKDILERQELYKRILEEIYSSEVFDDIASG